MNYVGFEPTTSGSMLLQLLKLPLDFLSSFMCGMIASSSLEEKYETETKRMRMMVMSVRGVALNIRIRR
jgi:hypothetical protein